MNPKINQLIENFKNPYMLLMLGLGFGLCYLVFFQPFILIGAVIIAFMVFSAFRDREKMPSLKKKVGKELKGWIGDGDKETKRMVESESEDETEGESAFGKPVQCLECGSRSFKHKLGCSKRKIGIHVEETNPSQVNAEDAA